MSRVLLGLIIAAGLLAGQVSLLMGAWAELPPQVAVHFGAGGVADGWGEKSSLVWIAGMVSVIILVCFHIPAVLMRWMPRGLMNMPNKDYWFAPGRADTTVTRLQLSMLGIGNLSLAAGLLFTSGLIDANLAAEPKLSPWFVPGIIAYTFGVIVWAIRLKRRFAVPGR